MGSLLLGAAFFAVGSLHHVDASSDSRSGEAGDAVLLLDRTLRLIGANHAAARLLQPLGMVASGDHFDFAHLLTNALADGRVRAEPSHAGTWLAALKGGDTGEIIVGSSSGMLLRLAGSALPDGQRIVTIADVTASRRRQGWLEIEYRRIKAAYDRLRTQAAAQRAVRLDAEAKATAAEARVAELERLAFTDQLTGLLNRRRLVALAEAELVRAKRYSRPLSVLMLDLDRFKQVNDRLGHDAGDAALCRVARICSASLRTGDLLARWGGEEFVALLPETDAAGAGRLAERLRTAIASDSAEQGDSAIALTVSIGVAELAGDEDTLSNIIGRADEALYAAKRAGRNLVLAATA